MRLEILLWPLYASRYLHGGDVVGAVVWAVLLIGLLAASLYWRGWWSLWIIFTVVLLWVCSGIVLEGVNC